VNPPQVKHPCRSPNLVVGHDVPVLPSYAPYELHDRVAFLHLTLRKPDAYKVLRDQVRTCRVLTMIAFSVGRRTTAGVGKAERGWPLAEEEAIVTDGEARCASLVEVEATGGVSVMVTRRRWMQKSLDAELNV
jgi:hypothetical protein